MAAAARELSDRGCPEAADTGPTLSSGEAVLLPPTREWVEREESWAYCALHLAAGVRARLRNYTPGTPDHNDELLRLAGLQGKAAEHLDELRRAGCLHDELLISMATAEGIWT